MIMVVFSFFFDYIKGVIKALEDEKKQRNLFLKF